MFSDSPALKYSLIFLLAAIGLSSILWAPEWTIQFLALVFCTILSVRFFAIQNGYPKWETALAYILFIIGALIVFGVMFGVSMALFSYAICIVFWYVLSNYFFPDAFENMKKSEHTPYNLWIAVLVYFFAIPALFTFVLLNLVLEIIRIP